MIILVTGCAGFIGQKVSEKLLKQDVEVIGVDNLNDYYDPRLKKLRLELLKEHEKFTFIKQDISNFERIEVLFKLNKLDAVINLAARAGVRASIKNPWIYQDTNVIGTLNLLECCRKYNINKFILASSSSVYGTNKTPFKEDDITDKTLSPYAASKKSAEVLCYTYHYLYGFDIAIPRFFTVYGPAGRPDMAYFKFMKNIDENKSIKVYGDGYQSRDFTYIDDIAEGTILSLQLTGYNIFNLGDNNPIILLDLIKLIEDGIGKKAQINFFARQPEDVLTTWADITKTHTLLGWHPKVGIEEGLRSTIKWYLENKDRIN